MEFCKFLLKFFCCELETLTNDEAEPPQAYSQRFFHAVPFVGEIDALAHFSEKFQRY